MTSAVKPQYTSLTYCSEDMFGLEDVYLFQFPDTCTHTGMYMFNVPESYGFFFCEPGTDFDEHPQKIPGSEFLVIHPNKYLLPSNKSYSILKNCLAGEIAKGFDDFDSLPNTESEICLFSFHALCTFVPSINKLGSLLCNRNLKKWIITYLI